METPRKKSTEPTPAATSSKAELLTGALIAVLSSPALAGPSIAAAEGVPPAPAALDPVGLIAAGTGIATVGAYQLMKMRARKGSDRKD